MNEDIQHHLNKEVYLRKDVLNPEEDGTL